MNAPELREFLHNQIELLDKTSLEAMYSAFQAQFGSIENFDLSEAHKELVDSRLEEYEKTPQNIISWEESDRLIKKRQ